MRFFVNSLMSVALVAAAAPAMAAQFISTINFTGGTASGTNGRIFTAGSGAEQIKVRASAWTLSTNGSSISKSTLGVYANGLGVTNSAEGNGGGNSHTIDNLSGVDFIILQFDKKVWLDTATFTAYQQSGLSYTDTDATIGWGNTAKAWDSNLNLTALNSGNYSLNSLIPESQRYLNGNVGTQGTNTRDIDPLLYSGNVWIVSAAMTNLDGKKNTYIDSFKLNYLNYTTKMPVPEPATWMMMIAGFGMIGSTIRRRRPVAPTVEATS